MLKSIMPNGFYKDRQNIVRSTLSVSDTTQTLDNLALSKANGIGGTEYNK
jgi:hypothetical protein